MPVAADFSASSSTTIGEHIRFRRPRNQQTRDLRPLAAVDDPTLTHVIPPTAQHTRLCKSAISSFFLLPNSSSSNQTTKKKPNGFHQTASFRGLGCTAATSREVSVPAVIRSSAEWETRNVKDKKKKKKKRNNSKNKKGTINGGSIKIVSKSRAVGNGGCVEIPDVWCGPGIGLSTDAVVGGSSVDTVVSGPGRRKTGDKQSIVVSDNHNNQRERSSAISRGSLNQESLDFLDSDSSLLTPRPEPAMCSDRCHCHLPHSSSDGLAEIMMLRNGYVIGGMFDSHDLFPDWRLDVDNMSYEQLLELGDRIGHVGTGLKEDEINCCLRKIKPSISNIAISNSTIPADKNCSICQEEYEMEEEMGKLKCGHSFHIECVKQWLSRKNSCPVCKTAACVRP